MDRHFLSGGDAANLSQLVAHRLRHEPLSPPHSTELEPAYTARVIQPALGRALSEANVSGLFPVGDGSSPVEPAIFLDRRFYPDFGAMYFDQRILAGEVKILRARQSQNAIATAVGQVTIYRESGYLAGVLCLVDLVGQFSDDAVRAATKELSDTTGVALVVRTATGNDALAPHVT